MITPIITGNWKMHNTIDESKNLVNQMIQPLNEIESVQTVLCPPFTSLTVVRELIKQSNVKLGAQNLHFATKGAFTGEISPFMVSELCEYVILGHSERRQYFYETDDIINLKVISSLKAGLTPILCVGENLAEREQGRANQIIETQLTACLQNLPTQSDLVVAYEPVCAIGTGIPSTSQMAQEMMSHIRIILESIFGTNTANEIALLYGGSVNPNNISELLSEKDINGALVGGASLNPKSFIEIVQESAKLQA